MPAYSFTGLGIECHEFQVSWRTEELYYCNCCFCSYQLSLYTSDVNLQVSLLRCIRHSVDGFEQVSSVDCSGIKGVNFQVSLHVVMLVIFS